MEVGTDVFCIIIMHARGRDGFETIRFRVNIENVEKLEKADK